MTNQLVNNSEKSNPTILEKVVSNFFNLLNTQDSLLRGIEGRLNSIVDRNQPQKDEIQEPKPEPTGFTQRIDREVSNLEQHNYRLERILKHLSEII